MTQATDNAVAREMAHEQEFLDMGIVAYRNRTLRCQQKGVETATDYGKSLMGQTIDPFAAGITVFIKEATSKPGPKALAVKFLAFIEEDVAAFIAVRVILDGISTGKSYNGVAYEIGSRIEDEVRFRAFEQQNKPLFLGVKKNLEKHPMGYQDRVRRSMLKHASDKFGIQHQPWSRTDKAHLGSKLIDIFIQATGLIRTQLHTAGKMKSIQIVPEDKLTQFISDVNSRSEIMAPFYMPTLIPPKPWAGPKNGGYWHPRIQTKLVKARMKGYLKELTERPMPVVYDAVNALQETPWKINTAVLAMVKQVWEAGLAVKGLPSRHDLPLPAKPADYDTNEDAKRAWKKGAGDVYRSNLKTASKRMQSAKIVWLAERFEREAAIYFPVQLDFRGRMYTLPQYLNPQGCDLAKGLITFGTAKPLGDRGVYWLAVHLCNNFGNDKIALDDRAAWTHAHSDRICRIATEPTSDLWWTEADKPFQFLAAVAEWAAMKAGGGAAYASSLPIMVDGSCNGIQHFSAMLRDEVAGTHVNLVPGPKPADIYQAVADQVIADLKAVVAESGEKAPSAARWLAYKISRKTCKRPVMVLPYGGSREAVRKYLMEHVAERTTDGGEKNPFGKDLIADVNYLATLVWKVMDKVVVGPRVAMDWLKDAAKVVSKEGLPIWWSTPSGFLVQQAYPETKSREVKTKVGDQIVKFRIAEDLDKLDKRKQAQAIAPNYVHSLDASALALTIVRCRQQGVGSFAAVHDSYGTHAADMESLQAALRGEFVTMYQECDVLAKFAQEVGGVLPDGKELPALPEKGTLDLTGVLRSDFFFA